MPVLLDFHPIASQMFSGAGKDVRHNELFFPLPGSGGTYPLDKGASCQPRLKMYASVLAPRNVNPVSR
jgi:hypothetical protein